MKKYRHRGGNNYTIQMTFAANDAEHIYGLGQESGNTLDKKNTAYELYQCNTKASIPVIYSSLGYGFFWNNPSVGRCSFDKKRSVWVADSAVQADYLVFTGENPQDVMYRYGLLTGFSPDMPEWVCGFWQSKLRYETQEEVRKLHESIKKKICPWMRL